MIVLDASVLIRYLDGADAQHEAADALLSRALDDELAANPVTIAEVLVGPGRIGRLEAAMSVLQALGVEELPFPVSAAAGLARLRATTGLKMPDCCVLLTASASGAAVASFDARLVRAAEGLGVPVFR